MTPSASVGALLGLALAGGLVLLWAAVPARRRPTIDDRVAPYVAHGTAVPERLELMLAERVVTPFPTLERIVRPHLAQAARWLERVLGGGAALSRRLEQAGREQSLHEFRLRQVLWAATSGGLAIGLSLLLLGTGLARSPAAMAVFCAGAAVGGVVACERRLAAQVRRRERRIMAEFPTVADLLALAVGAGEGPIAALERVARVSDGELAGELRRVLGHARTGAGLVEALDAVAERTSLPVLARFADGIAVALERGTPLADVLRAQAIDVREARTRWLLEIGGRKEILMMVPVVFLVLPVTVVFALYPGLVQISTVVP